MLFSKLEAPIPGAQCHGPDAMKLTAAVLLLLAWAVGHPVPSLAAEPAAQDRRFVEQASRAGLVRLETAEQALAKAHDGRVRTLAERVVEDRVEVALPRSRRAVVVAALRAAHPYEEPSFHVLANVADETP